MGFWRSHNSTTTAERINEFQINSASYGEVVPEVLGTTRQSGNVIYYDDFTAHEHKSTQRTGKGGGSKHTNITYTYSVACAIGLCEGPISGIGKVWIDKEIFTYPQSEIQLTLFDGRLGQQPWPYVVSKHPEKALPYSGLAYMAGVVDLGERGSLPNYNFEVKGKLLDTGDGIDVNPADYIVHILKGVGIDASQIEGVDNYRRYCRAADILISTPPNEGAKKAQAIINEIAEITNAILFWSNDRLKIVPLADESIRDWDPHLQVQYDLTADDLIPGSDGQLVIYKRKDTSECYNQATVEFLNRANNYEKETVSFEVVADVQKNGMRPASTKQAHYLYTKARAQYYAEQLAMKRLYSRNQYTFHLSWEFCRLEPGDIVTLTDDICQLNKQIVIITAVSEAADGQLEITAEGKPPGTYAPAKYNVHENERPFIDYNIPAPSVNDVAIFQTVGDVGGNQVFVGVNAPDNWGGCSVWLSDDNQRYRQIGEITQQARMGRMKYGFSSTNDFCNIVLNRGVLQNGTHIDAERGNTLCWVDGEALSYETVEMHTNNWYTLKGLVRGQYGTKAISHNANERFIRVDEAIFRAPYRPEDVGKKIYLKFSSRNMFGTNEQGLDEVQAYEYTITPYYIPEVNELALYTKYYKIGDGVLSYDVVATFTAPDLNTFDTAEAWYREGAGEWKYGGNGNGQIVISGCELGHTYEVKVKVKDSHGNYSQGITKSILVQMKSDVPNTPQGFSVTFGSVAQFNWLEVRNADIDYYELRTNLNPGQSDGLIGRSNNTTYAGMLTERQGKVYLYAHNPSKGYGAPANVEYNVPVPKAPTTFIARAGFGSVGVLTNAIPANCKGMNVYINETVYFSATNAVTFPLNVGIYRVRVAFVDIFGEGAKTAEQPVAILEKIPKELLDTESLGLDKMDKAIESMKNDVSAVKKVSDGFESRLTDLANGTTKSISDLNKHVESRFTQLSDGFDARITEALGEIDGDKLIARINLSKSGTRIDGKLFHVTSKTVFDANVIAKGMIQANAVTAENIDTPSLSAICATIGTLRTRTTGARVEIQDNLISAYDEENNVRVKLGCW